ncbi:hypothetical protein [uncultured Azohydromonas sp.]|uniref:hypothetical protein n=1 Tax=uncultured Azohydromonas sp. TaxID=487342 RepID=UPI00261BCC90|nr:hypothetical protein [uncultured Azohydromonas sp.]
MKRPSDQQLAEDHQQAIKDHLQKVLQDPAAAGFSDEHARAYVRFMDPDAAPPAPAEGDAYTRAWDLWERIRPIDEEADARRIRRPGESNLEMSDRNANLKRLKDEREKLLNELQAIGVQQHPEEAGNATAASAPQVEVRTIVHSTTAERRDALRPAIEEAQRRCRNSADVAEVWNAMRTLADEQYGSLVGTLPDGSIKHRDGVLKRKALAERLRREGRQRPSNPR